MCACLCVPVRLSVGLWVDRWAVTCVSSNFMVWPLVWVCTCKDCQRLSKIVKDCQRLSKIVKDCKKMVKDCQRLLHRTCKDCPRCTLQSWDYSNHLSSRLFQSSIFKTIPIICLQDFSNHVSGRFLFNIWPGCLLLRVLVLLRVCVCSNCVWYFVYGCEGDKDGYHAHTHPR